MISTLSPGRRSSGVLRSWDDELAHLPNSCVTSSHEKQERPLARWAEHDQHGDIVRDGWGIAR